MTMNMGECGRPWPTSSATRWRRSTASGARPIASSSTAPRAWPRRCARSGVGPGTKVAMYVYNAPEYLETCFAAFKLRAVPVNVNYRYLADELHYLLDNADAEALIYHGALAERVQAVRDRLPKLRTLIQVATTEADRVAAAARRAIAYEDVLAAHAPAERIAALARRSRLPLHRRHHRPAEGRHVAPQRSLHRLLAGLPGDRRGARRTVDGGRRGRQAHARDRASPARAWRPRR